MLPVLLIGDDRDLSTIAKAQLQKVEPMLYVMTTQFPQGALRQLEREHFNAVVSGKDLLTKAGRCLGLTIVRKVFEVHSWQIRLDTTPQTTFRITLTADK